ncbi:carboxymuconolactone decarboxylase family protein [Paraburkholderia sp. BL10I2N1]|uniref:carboxymuconolactone decarboxylase family protein n=1 Tax=Paraburkholderia sp. BL10I2N1 TaxID=1938796 RepID=UPI00105E7D23|nr:carboxymuconolactone decarboxylase family protein [Paraburkholderia sp. BL10I2N1]TDN63313.1 alkylhydroperoxidase/carboxymuconolactone decarboxylase family protein YurZ [Paraburkholderia sp. BL10I2N1]
MALTVRQQAIKDEFIRVRNTWAPQWKSILRMDCEFLNAYLKLSAVPLTHNYLENKVKEFIYIAVNASSTHLFAPGIQIHIKAAIEFGATRDELMEVLELTSTVGIHASNVGVPILLEVLEEEGLTNGATLLDDRQEALKRRFIEEQGYWDASWSALLTLDPDMFEAYFEFSAIPWRTGKLDAKTKDLVLCALDAAATHLYKPGIKTHMRNAIRHGATAHEIMEVLEIVSVIGIHGALIGTPLLEDSLAASAGK